MAGRSKVELRVDWCDIKAARYAVENWHYSKCLPAGHNVYLGVWENGRFVGSVVFGVGANQHLSKPFGLERSQACELVRIALSRQHQTEVSRILRFAIKKLTLQSPGLRCIVSYADQSQGHHGGVYQAHGWVFCGMGGATRQLLFDGKMHHQRRFTGDVFGTKTPIPPGAVWVDVLPKYRYALGLDDEFRERLKAMAQPYPKRVASIGDAPPNHGGESGSNREPRSLLKSGQA